MRRSGCAKVTTLRGLSHRKWSLSSKMERSAVWNDRLYLAYSTPGSIMAPGMGSTLASQLHAARMRQFVGRTDECQAFAQALDAQQLSAVLFYVHGPGGVGKTWLLKQWAQMAADAGALTLILDGRNLEASSAGFYSAFAQAAGRGDSGAAFWQGLDTRSRQRR